MAPTNHASFIIKPKQLPFVVKEAPYTAPRANEITIRVHALAVNPIDYILPEQGNMIYGWLKYPFIFGFDVAGSVVEVGPGAETRFQPGDRVVGIAAGSDKARNRQAEGGFQEYVVLMADMTSAMPENLSYEQAAVLPLGLSTAAVGLFQDDQLALQLPSARPRKPTGQTVIVWGGSTSVGSNAIQLAVAAGYEVITTSSPRNFEYCRQLGAREVFDYNSRTVVADIIKAMQGQIAAGACAIGDGAIEALVQVMRQCKVAPGGKKHIAMFTFPAISPAPTSFVLPRTLLHLGSFFGSLTLKGYIHGITWKFVSGTSLVTNRVGAAVWGDFLPQALADGSFVAKPDPQVFGKGLESVWPACEELRKGGISAKKIVVTLE